MQPLKNYLINAGSEAGPAGFVTRVIARSKEKALRVAKHYLPTEADLSNYLDPDHYELFDRGYFSVFLDPGTLTVEDIPDGEIMDPSDYYTPEILASITAALDALEEEEAL